jgi:hypothetical protein
MIAPPSISQQPTNQSVAADSQVTFSVAANGEGSLSYQWQRDGVDVAGATMPQHAFIARAADNGSRWTVQVRNASPTVTTSQAATLAVTAAGPGISLLSGDIRGEGFLDGAGSLARLTNPSQLIVDDDGSIFFAETPSQIIRKVSATGVVTRIAGTTERGYVDGNGAAARFSDVRGIGLDRQRGILYVMDGAIRTVNRQGDVGTFHNPGEAAPPMYGLAVGPDGSVYFSAGRVFAGLSCCVPTAIYKIAPQGGNPVLIAGSISENGQKDGEGAQARFNNIVTMAVDNAGTLFVTDGATLRMITPERVVSSPAGTTTMVGVFNDPAGAVYGRAWDTKFLVRISSTGAISNYLPFPAAISGVYLDNAGGMLYARQHEIGRIGADGSLQPLAGTVRPEADLKPGNGLVVDSQGNLFTIAIDSAGTGSLRIRKYNAAGQVVPFGPSGELEVPRLPNHGPLSSMLAIDAADNLYVAFVQFQGNGPVGGLVYRIAPNGQISTLISSTSTQLPFIPALLTANSKGEIFVVSSHATSSILYKVSAEGVPAKIADLPESIRRRSNWGGFQIAADNDGHVFLVSHYDAVVYRIGPDGSVVVLAGLVGTRGQRDAQGVAARFLQPAYPVVDSKGVLFVQDAELIRKISPDGVVTTVAGQPGQRGTRLGTLPGALAVGPFYTTSITFFGTRMAIDRNDVFYLEAGEALLKIRLK